MQRELIPFTLPHFREWAGRMVWDDGEQRDLEDWQYELIGDLFDGFKRNLWIIPEENGKSTLVALLALYGADYTEEPWIPVCASVARQARIIHDQAAGFIRRSPAIQGRFVPQDGYLRIKSTDMGGKGIEVFAYDRDRADGIIPAPFAICDELHAMPDVAVWELWGRKLRKRNAQLLGITTGGEPETPFETMRDAVRRRATDRQHNGAHLRAVNEREVLHEWMVSHDEDCSDMAKVKEANPLSRITVGTLKEDFDLITDLGDWKRCKCNRPTRSSETAIADKEWDEAETEATLPDPTPVILGLDVAWKLDTTAIVPLWKGPDYRLILDPVIIEPPRDGSSIHPDKIKGAIAELVAKYRVEMVVMDMHRAEDIAHWIEDYLELPVIDHAHGKVTTHVQDFRAFTEGLRNGTLKHTGDHGLRAHVLNAIARRLPGGDYRFDRPSSSRANRLQDKRVIDALSAAAMAVEVSGRPTERKSRYSDPNATMVVA
jgi:phage terminase large subunit-like protein